MSYKKKTILLILLFFVLRCIIAFVLELSNDESYYWTYSKYLKWNYFDHPPMIAYCIRLFSLNLLLQQYEGFIRLGSVVCGSLATWFIYKAASSLASDRAGWYAACLYSSSFYAGIMAGLHAMPDAPQMVFWTFCLWMLARIYLDERNRLYWILFGVSAGLCIMSKIHGVFIWLGLALFALMLRRYWLAKPHLYVALVLSLIIASPILIWNMQNHFATYFFHSGRITVPRFVINAQAFFEELTGQFFYNNPFHFIIVISALVAMHKGHLLRKQPLLLFNFIGLPLALLLLLIALFRDTLPHWNGPAYVSLLPMAGIYLSEKHKGSVYPKLLRWGMIGFVAFMIAWPLVNNYLPGTYGERQGITLGTGDVTLDKYGWRQAGKQFAQLYHAAVIKGEMPAGAPVVCYKWWGAHVEYYFCRPLGTEMVGLGEMNTLHEYLWTNRQKLNGVNMAAAWCIVPSDEYYDVHERYSRYYERIDSVATIKILRNNRQAHNFYVYALRGWRGNVELDN